MLGKKVLNAILSINGCEAQLHSAQALRVGMLIVILLNVTFLGNQDIRVKLKILVLNEMKLDEILLKLKAKGREKLY